MERNIIKGNYRIPVIPRNTKEEIKVAKGKHNESLKKPETYREIRDNLARIMINHVLPKWDTIKIQIVNWRKKPRRTSPTY